MATLLAALGSILIAGTFFAYATLVLPAVSRMTPKSGIRAMQAITLSAKGPLFLLVFFGTAALAAILGVAAPFRWSEPNALYLLAGSLLYLNGPLGITLLRNLPLNKKLAIVNADSDAGVQVWKDYLPDWSLWNLARVITGLAAGVCFIVALLRQAA
jgi:uncharacterized membrane protein